MNWPMVKLGDLFKITSGGTPSRKKAEFYEDGDIPWIKTGDLHRKYVEEASEYITEAGLKGSSTRLYPKGTVLLAMYGATIGACSILSIEACTNQACAAFTPSDDVDCMFLYYLLKHNQNTFVRAGAGGAQPNISVTFLKSFKIPLPPLDEQKRIAAILDKADAIRQKRKQAIALADDFLRSVFLDMFGDPVTNPKGWEVKLCKNIFKRITVGVVVKPSSYYVERGIPALRSLNISPYGIDSKNLVYISSTDNEQALSKSRVYEGDLVLVRSGQPGKTAVITNEFSGVNAIDILIATPDRELVEPDFFAYFMNSAGGQRIVGSEQRGQIQKHFNVGSMNAAEIPLPPLEKQKEFCKVLSIVKDKYLWNTDESYDLVFNSLSQKAFSDQL